VARPGVVSARRRSLVEQRAQTPRLAWTASLPVTAVVWAERDARDFPPLEGRTRMALLAASTDAADLREKLSKHAPVHIVWDPRECRTEGCRHAFVGRVVDARTVALTRGTWPTEAAAGMETRCAALAREQPGAVEVFVGRDHLLLPGQDAFMPERTERVLRARRPFLAVSTTEHFRSEEARRHAVRSAANQAERELRTRAQRAWWEASRRRVAVELRLSWEDLRLVAAAEDRVRRARRGEHPRRVPTPVDDVDVSNLGAARYQVDLREERLAESYGAAHRRQAASLRRLLERVVARHPDELDLAMRLGRLLVGDLAAGDAAAKLAQEVIAQGPPRVERWRMLGREAQALRGVQPLAGALVRDGLAEGADALPIAAELVRLTRRGIAYERAERAVRGVRGTRQALDAQRPRSVGAASLPWSSFVEAMVTLARLGGVHDAALRPIEVVVWPAFVTSATESVVRVETGPRQALFLRADPGEEDRLRALGEALEDAMGEGPVEVAVVLRSVDGDRADRVLGFRGRGAGDAFVLEGARGAAARVAYGRVQRYLATPLAVLGGVMYPPPELTLETPSRSVAEHLAELQPAGSSVECRIEGATLTCVPPAFGDRQAMRVLVERFAADRLAEEAARLVERSR
jgi:hypothetical protein